MKIIKLINAYRSKNGNPVFVHSFDATKEELKALDDAGTVYKKDTEDGHLVFLSEEFKQDTELRVAKRTNRIYAVTPMQSKAVQSATNSMSALNNMLNSGVDVNPQLIQLAFGAQ